MKKALVIGASGGIGQAVAAELGARGVPVTGLSRGGTGFDVTDPAGVERALSALTEPFDLVFVALGILAPPGGAPEKTLAAIDAGFMAQVLAVNTIGPALILRHVARLLPRDRRAVCAVLSARVGSIGDNRIGGWHSYRASKAALNQIVHGAAIEISRTHRQAVCVALHPGTVATPFTAAYAGKHPTVPPSEAARNLIAVMEALTPAQSGGFFDYSGAVVPW
jgi:NAD(P)-dependent dehydrogenase (short-subunit alcohol dehydrogenase family)